jgi:hypothetical protein
LQFPVGNGARVTPTFGRLTPWNENSDSNIKYFSGTATYETTFNCPSITKGRGRRIYLNLGRVAVMADVRLNGKNLGILWKPPFEIDVTDEIRSRNNLLQIKVTNLWPNRMIGDEQLPEDSKRKPNGTLEEWPEWLLKDQPSPAGRHTFTTYRLWKKNGVLQTSGLLGPVMVSCRQELQLRAK